MTDDPFRKESSEPAGQNQGGGQRYGPPQGQPAYGQPQYGAPQYGPPQGQPAYGQPPYGQPQYGAPQQPYGQPQYGAPQGQPYGYAPTIAKPTGWFIVNWLFFWPLAIYSLVTHWSNIDRDAFAGNMAGAQAHADSVRKLGIVALCIGIAWIALVIILDVALFTSTNCQFGNC